jgi:hypothetical protein
MCVKPGERVVSARVATLVALLGTLAHLDKLAAVNVLGRP